MNGKKYEVRTGSFIRYCRFRFLLLPHGNVFFDNK
jgi:hypothetical protein